MWRFQVRVQQLRRAAGARDRRAKLVRPEYGGSHGRVPGIRHGTDAALAVGARIIVTESMVIAPECRPHDGFVVAEYVPGHAHPWGDVGPASGVERGEGRRLGELRRLARYRRQSGCVVVHSQTSVNSELPHRMPRILKEPAALVLKGRRVGRVVISNYLVGRRHSVDV